MHSPLDQFKIVPLLPLQWRGIDISFTNSSLAMVLTVAMIVIFGFFAARKTTLIPHTMQNIGESLWDVMEGVMLENVGPQGRSFVPFVLALFMFLLFGNVLGMLPYQFTFTSHIIVTFTLALVVFGVVTALGCIRHGWHFLSLFLPKGTPLLLAPLVIPIEIISYLSRPLSLSIRLFANMMAGHTILKVFATFVVALGVWGFVPFVLSVLLTGFEFMVSILQAYVFSVLTCVYLRDAIDLH